MPPSASRAPETTVAAKPWKHRIDWFLMGMIAAVGLAALFPSPGAQGGWMHPELLTNLGVALIFFWGCSRLANMLGYYNEDKSLQVIEERSATAS